MTADADIWADTIRRARQLHPHRIAADINATADSGLRAARYDKAGGRTTATACDDPKCHDGDPEITPHSHQLTSDPTGNAAVNHRRGDDTAKDRLDLSRAVNRFVMHADTVLDWVSGNHPSSWADVVTMNARLMPGTIQAGLDVDDERRLPRAISEAAKAVTIVQAVAASYGTRTPSQDEQHWTSGLGDNDVCAWHLSIHRRYRRPRLPGKNICADCVGLATLLGQRPPQWLLEAEVDREAKPRAWTAALGRCMDELGVERVS